MTDLQNATDIDIENLKSGRIRISCKSEEGGLLILDWNPADSDIVVLSSIWRNKKIVLSYLDFFELPNICLMFEMAAMKIQQAKDDLNVKEKVKA